MPLRSDWIMAREGFTFDTILGLIRKEYALQNPIFSKWLRRFAIASAVRKVSNLLDQGMMNNWKNDSYDWKKEIIVVTGGSDGIGAKIVQLFAEMGITVVVLDIQPPKYTTGPNIHYFNCDLANPSTIRYIAAGIQQHVGNPTILINNAGFARGNSILSASEMDIKLTFQINTLSHYHLAQAFLPEMIKRNHGMIVTVASLAAYVTSPGLVDYSASKAAALVFHEGLSAELATLHKAPAVRSIVLCQGYTRTPLFQGFHSGDGFINYALQPETVAEEVVKAVLRGQSDHIILPRGNSYITGLRLWPSWMQSHVRKDLQKMMTNWNGRQVTQPLEEKEAPSKVALGVEGSAVLV